MAKLCTTVGQSVIFRRNSLYDSYILQEKKNKGASISLIFGAPINEPDLTPKMCSYQCHRPLSVHSWYFVSDFASEVVLCFTSVAILQVKLSVVVFCSISPNSLLLIGGFN